MTTHRTMSIGLGVIRRAPLTSGGTNGSRPTSSPGGPSAARRATASRTEPCSGGSVADTAAIAAAYGEPASVSASPSSSSPARCSSSSRVPAEASTVAANSSTTLRWSGSSVVVEHVAEPAVGLLDPQQGQAALAGVAVREVGQVQRVAAAQVEGRDVVAARTPPGCARGGRATRPAGRRRRRAGRRRRYAGSGVAPEGVVGVQQEPGDLPDDGHCGAAVIAGARGRRVGRSPATVRRRSLRRLGGNRPSGRPWRPS